MFSAPRWNLFSAPRPAGAGEFSAAAQIARPVTFARVELLARRNARPVTFARVELLARRKAPPPRSGAENPRRA